MALRQGWAVNSVSIDAPDARLAMAGLLLRDRSHVVRAGVLSAKVRTLVTARSDMRVDVSFFNAVFTRAASYGALLFSNDATTQVTFDPAPTSNSRIDVLYVLLPDTSQGETAASPSFQVAKGTAAASPQKPSVPVGGFELATVQIPSTATTTSSANVVITQTFKHTAPQGSRFPVRSLTELNAETNLPEGTQAYLDNGTSRTYRYDGTNWRLWEQPPTDTTLSLSSSGFNLGTLGGMTALTSVRAGTVRVDFRGRAAGSNVSWGNIKYTLPIAAYDVFGSTMNTGNGVAELNDNDGGVYGAWVGLTGDGSFQVFRTGTSNASLATWASSQPFTIGVNDTVQGYVEYPAA